jgi:hypothetical protein
MPPRRGARAVGAASEATGSAFASLPQPLLSRILAALPVDSRARACCVCRGWRDVLAELALWTELDLSDDSGVSGALDATALLEGASRRARGQLNSLKLGRAFAYFTEEVLEVLAANAGSLRKLRLRYLDAIPPANDPRWPNRFEVRMVVHAAPQLQLLDVLCMSCAWEMAPLMLRAEGALAPLRMHRLGVYHDAPMPLGFADSIAPLAAALADAALQPALSQLEIMGVYLMHQPAAMDALVDAVMARPQLGLTFQNCTLPAPAPLASLLRDGTLTSLTFDLKHGNGAPFFDAAGAVVVADALRANTTLKGLYFTSAGLLRNVAASVTLLGALVGHPSLTALELRNEETADPAAVGVALAALVAADAPALRMLRLDNVGLRRHTIAPLVDALAGNRHLCELRIMGTGLRPAFVYERLPAAPHAN